MAEKIQIINASPPQQEKTEAPPASQPSAPQTTPAPTATPAPEAKPAEPAKT
jgi:hypothetical protein